ncbi:MAG TPA: hypothetical protein DHW82_11925 [Spirochaetia bacterium]|nr:MAG: hypothetical protein A2Y41_12465 [Spirochaetes bacterium GWB1_36_13]HCL57699.1 hypothetical protein [Spirochaetia bacterium]
MDQYRVGKLEGKKVGFVEFYGLGDSNQIDGITIGSEGLNPNKVPIHGLRYEIETGIRPFTIKKGSFYKYINVDVKENELTLIKIESVLLNSQSSSYVSGNIKHTTTSFTIQIIPHPVVLPYGKESVQKLLGFLENKDWVIRWHAVQLLIDYKDQPEVLEAIKKISTTDPSEEVKNIATNNI